jgi:hypothetical protein
VGNSILIVSHTLPSPTPGKMELQIANHFPSVYVNTLPSFFQCLSPAEIRR